MHSTRLTDDMIASDSAVATTSAPGSPATIAIRAELSSTKPELAAILAADLAAPIGDQFLGPALALPPQPRKISLRFPHCGPLRPHHDLAIRAAGENDSAARYQATAPPERRWDEQPSGSIHPCRKAFPLKVGHIPIIFLSTIYRGIATFTNSGSFRRHSMTVAARQWRGARVRRTRLE